MKKVTMSDIAKEMGISTVSVSKALSGKEGVSQEVREQICRKAEEMGYQYKTDIKILKPGRNNTVGVLVSERFYPDNAFYSDLYRRIVREFGKRKYSCILEIVSRNDEGQCAMPNMLRNRNVDGLIVMGQMGREYVRMIHEDNVPFVFLDFYDDYDSADSVVSDSVYGAYLLTDYLVKQGHKRIGFVGDVRATSSILDRYLGYYKALIQNGLDERKEWIINDRNDAGEYVAMRLPQNMPDAFLCNCDETAYHFMNCLKEQGYRIPEDVSIVGFDDFIYAKLCEPMLTTFRIDLQTMSEAVVDVVVKKIYDETYRIGRKVISGEVVVRDSVMNRAADIAAGA